MRTRWAVKTVCNAVVVGFVVFSLTFAGMVMDVSAASPRYGGTLKWVVQEPYSLGYPATMTGQTDGQTASVCLETLFLIDEKGNLAPLLATAWTSDPAAKTITLTLRKGVKFHDGSDFNAEVCKWNLDQFRSGKRPDLKKIDSIDIVDDYTIRLNFSVFDNTITTVLGTCSDAGRMISKKAFEANGLAWCEQHPVGTGPFKFVSHEKEVAIKWERFDDYWGGKPYLDGIEQLRIADATVALMAFQSGDIHILIPNANEARILESQKEKYTLVVRPQGQVPALAGYANDPNSPFANVKVRQAMAHALDVQTLAKAFGLGYWKVQNQWAIPDTWGYNPDVIGYPYNPEKAKQLLAEAGYPDGFKTKLHFFNLAQSYVDEMTAIQRYLKAVGIDGELVGLQRPKFAEIASLGSGWEGVVRMQGYSNPDPLIKYAGVAAGQEFKGAFLPPEFTELYKQATAAPDFETKKKLVHDLMKMATDEYCIAAHLYVKMSPIFKTKQLHDDHFGPVPFGYLSPKAWLEK